VLRNLIVLLKFWWEKKKKRKEQIVCFVLQKTLQGNLFILKSWMEVATWVEEIQLVAKEITKGKPCRIGCTIQRMK
jgi:hypothetical protein